MLRLIRRYLQAGMMQDGLMSQRERGTPQGGPLSPLLSNILLDDLDKELERRGHAFCRYADDGNIYVRSRTAGERVLITSQAGTYGPVRVHPIDIRPGNLAVYFPEANVLVPRRIDASSRTPVFKSVAVRVARAGAS